MPKLLREIFTSRRVRPRTLLSAQSTPRLRWRVARPAVAFLASLVLIAQFAAVPANAQFGHKTRHVQHEVITLNNGYLLKLTTTREEGESSSLAARALVASGMSSWIETVAVVTTSWGTPAARFTLHTNYYWDSGTVIQVSPYTLVEVTAPGYGHSGEKSGWFWTSYPTNANSWGQVEIDSYTWTPFGSMQLMWCTIHLDHYVSGYGSAYGGWWKSGGGWAGAC